MKWLWYLDRSTDSWSIDWPRVCLPVCYVMQCPLPWPHVSLSVCVCVFVCMSVCRLSVCYIPLCVFVAVCRRWRELSRHCWLQVKCLDFTGLLRPLCSQLPTYVFCFCFLFLCLFLYDFSQNNYLQIYQIDLCQIFRVGELWLKMNKQKLGFYRAMLCIRGTSLCPFVCLSVSVSVKSRSSTKTA